VRSELLLLFETLISQTQLSGRGAEKPLLEFADYCCTLIRLMELFAGRSRFGGEDGAQLLIPGWMRRFWDGQLSEPSKDPVESVE